MVLKYYQQIIAGTVLVAFAFWVLFRGTAIIQASQLAAMPFSGPHWKHKSQTLESSEVFNSKYLRVESHTLRSKAGAIINGWMWVDFLDQVNVLAQNGKGQYLVIRQTKYGVAHPSLSVVAGSIAVNEQPSEAAARELHDELGMESREWTFLGKYRTDANRGGGFVYSFLASNVQPTPGGTKFPSNELEPQEVVTLSAKEISDAVLEGQFAEAKWCNTVALALLRAKTDKPPTLSLDAAKIPLNQRVVA
jgi:ADP-ribose pyrophosphatase YjhB (NUDIX family)